MNRSTTTASDARLAAPGTRRYLLITHVPFGRGATAATYRLGDMWLEDLRAQRRALGGVCSLLVAAPLLDHLDEQTSGSFNLADFDPRREGIEYVPLPAYGTWPEFVRVRPALRRALVEALRRCDVVQADYGGHPVSLGQVAWPLAGHLQKTRIWLFDGADPFPRLERAVAADRNPVTRALRRGLVTRFAAFCRRAVTEADLVFAHNHAVAARFADVWTERCHLFPRSFVRDELLVSDAALQARHATLRRRDRPLRLVAAGRQITIKGTDHVLRALAALRRAGVEMEFVVIGDGEDLSAFKQLAADLGLGDAVRFVGVVPYGAPLFDQWDQADVMVITNLTAEISRNVLLAMARGLPVVLYRNPGTDALVEGHDAALLVPTGDIEALAATLRRIHDDRDLLGRVSTNGLALARTHTLEGCHRARARLVAQCLGIT